MSEEKMKRSTNQRQYLTNMDWEALESISKVETERFREFIHTHPIQEITVGERNVTFCISGKGDPAVLIFTGAWGGPELAYETILALEDRHRVIVIDVGSIDHPTNLAEITDTILDQEGINRVAIVGQSVSGILGQVYFRQKPGRVDRMVLALTPAPHQKKAKKWALALIQKIPLFLFRLMLAKSLKRLSRTIKPIPEEATERLAFKGALMARIFRGYATRKKLLGMLKLAFALSSAGDYTKEEVSGWPGKLLVITSPDDPYYKDTQVFQEVFPSTEVVTLAEGFGHVAAQVFRQMFFSAIQSFLAK